MVKSYTTYMGDLHCAAKHEPSESLIETDAPVDNNGRGEAFSPTDLVGAALAACMSTIMGMVAQRKGVDLNGMVVEVNKTMSANPRRIAKLETTITVPLPADSPLCSMIEHAALSCPVKHSLHPDIEIPITWIWNGPSA